MRNTHYWKKAGPAAAPSNIIVVDAEAWHGKRTWVEPGVFGKNAGEYQQFRLGVALAYRLERGTRTRQQLLRFTSRETFWNLARARRDERRPLWIFAHNAGYDVPVLGGWRIILGNSFVAEDVILTQSMFLIRGKWDGYPVIFSDLANYYHCRLEDVGRSVGRPKLKMPDQARPDSEWFTYCENDVLITADGLDKLIEYQRQHELGPWAISIAGLAFNAFRSRFMRHKILVTADRDVSTHERNAYYGGLVDTNFVGRVPASPVHELDVNSMYGWACEQLLPHRLIPTRFTPSVRSLKDYDRDQICIAEVTIDHESLRFPVRTRIGTIYPVGRYRTTLASPELDVALVSGAVRSCHRAQFYRSGHIFAEYMEYFGNQKIKYEGSCNCIEGFGGNGLDCVRCGRGSVPDPAFRQISKYFITNLYGKTAQKRPVWEKWGEQSLQRRERELGMKPGALAYRYEEPPERDRFQQIPWMDRYGNVCEVRNWFGFIEIQGERDESRDSVPAIAATVTSHARRKIRQYHTVCGERDWFYTDTDSIWVTCLGLARLYGGGYISTGRIGGLEYEQPHEYLQIHGPKDYESEKGLKLKGIKARKREDVQEGDIAIPVRIGEKEWCLIVTKDGKYRQTQFTKPLTQLRKQQFDGVFVAHMEKGLNRRIDKCKVMTDGWTRPLKFPEENPDRC